MRKITTTCALLVTALGVCTGTAGATPETDNVGYTTTVTETATTITTDAGSLAVEDGVFKIKAANGADWPVPNCPSVSTTTCPHPNPHPRSKFHQNAARPID